MGFIQFKSPHHHHHNYLHYSATLPVGALCVCVLVCVCLSVCVCVVYIPSIEANWDSWNMLNILRLAVATANRQRYCSVFQLNSISNSRCSSNNFTTSTSHHSFDVEHATIAEPKQNHNQTTHTNQPKSSINSQAMADSGNSGNASTSTTADTATVPATSATTSNLSGLVKFLELVGNLKVNYCTNKLEWNETSQCVFVDWLYEFHVMFMLFAKSNVCFMWANFWEFFFHLLFNFWTSVVWIRLLTLNHEKWDDRR